MTVIDREVEQIDYGARIKDLRTQLGWEQKELARRSGVHVVTLSKLERGHEASPKIDTLAKIARAFGIPLEVLIRRKRVLLGIKIEPREEEM